MNENRKILISGAAIAIFIAILAPFIASSNPDGLNRNVIELVGGGSEKKAAQAVGEKDAVGYRAPLAGYSIAGLGKEGQVLAVLIGTLIMIAVALGFRELLKKRKESKQS